MCSLKHQPLRDLAPAVVLDQFAHLLVHTLGEWASVMLALPLHLDLNEDAVDVLSEAPTWLDMETRSNEHG